MVNVFIENITNDFRQLKRGVVLTENPDGFLLKNEIMQALKDQNIFVIGPDKIDQRIAFELRDSYDGSKILIFITEDNNSYLEDIQKISASHVFHFSSYFHTYFIPSIINCDLHTLNKLYRRKQIVDLSKKETEDLISDIKEKKDVKSLFDLNQFQTKLKLLINENAINWFEITKLLSEAILDSIDSDEFQDVMIDVNRVNEIFQNEIHRKHNHLTTANHLRRPKIVSGILNYLAHKHEKKLALIVIDGMAFWQYLLLKKRINDSVKISENHTYSWLPSITQLSRQAIFKGTIPSKEYIQNPKNEEKLWQSFWLNQNTNKFEIRYNHEEIDLSGLDRITKFGLVFKDLDDKMHSSSDYADLKDLTENWIDRSQIISIIDSLIIHNFEIYLTTDHGNVQAKGWRSLNGREKLGTNKSGSKSTRHIEYTENWLAEEFMKSNPDIKEFLVKEENAIYFNNDLSFTTENHLVTHGGSHILEVVIPFIKIE